MAKGYTPQGLGLNEPGANRASSPKAGTKYAKPINPNKSSGQLDGVLGQGPDASYTKFVQSGGLKTGGNAPSQPKQSGGGSGSGTSSGKPNQNPNFKMPAPDKAANAEGKGIGHTLGAYGKAFLTSPAATVKDIATGQKIKDVNNGAIIVQRAPVAITAKVKQQQSKNLPPGTPGQLDHTQPLEIGGDNNPKNLKLIPKSQDQANNSVEDYLGGQLKANVINAQQAKILNQQYKNGQISAEDVYNAAKKGGKPPSTGPSLTSKIVKTTKAIGSGMTTGEQTTGKVLARLLPGGQNDIKAENAAIDQNLKDLHIANQLIQSGDPKKVAVGKKLLAQNKVDMANTSKDVQATAKSIPTRGQAVAGVASTAADILTAGTLPELKGAAVTAKVAKGANAADKAAEASKGVKAANAGIKAAEYGTAGALNSAAGGGDKKQMAENFVAGAALPGVLHVAGKGGTSLVNKVTGGQATRDLITNAKTTSLLSKVDKTPPAVNAVVNHDNVVAGMYHPEISTTKMAEIHIPADNVSKVDAAKVSQYVKQIKDGEPIEPVVVQHVNGQTMVVDGQQRLAAMNKLGITDVPTVEKQPGPVDVNAGPNTGAKTPAAGATPPVAPVEGSVPKTAAATPVTAPESAAPPAPAAPIDTAPIKEQIKGIQENEKSYDKNGNLTPEAGKQITGLQKQLNAAGERVPKAEKPVTVTPTASTPDIKIPEIRVSKLAQGVEANAIKKGLADGFEGKAEYAKVNVGDQAKAAADLIKSDPQRALRIAMGHEQPPEGLLPESVFIAVEKQATKAGDSDMLRQLATESHLTSEASGMGQRIRMLGERDTNSAVSNIKSVVEARKAAAEKKLGKPVTKAVSDEVKQIRAAKPKVTKETWGSFVDSLKC